MVALGVTLVRSTPLSFDEICAVIESEVEMARVQPEAPKGDPQGRSTIQVVEAKKPASPPPPRGGKGGCGRKQGWGKKGGKGKGGQTLPSSGRGSPAIESPECLLCVPTGRLLLYIFI